MTDARVPTANFIGCGKLGKTIAYLLNKHHLIKIQNIYTQSLQSTLNSIQFIGAGNSCEQVNKLTPADIYFITLPDDLIETSCENILKSHRPNCNAIFVHFSGSLTSDSLHFAKKLNYETCSLHPMKSFANPQENIKSFTDTYCAIEGSIIGIQILSDMFEKIGGKLFQIHKDKKPLYHTAAVISSNYLITLASCAQECFINSGIDKDISIKLILSLMESTIYNISKLNNLTLSLTGPIQRGDVETIKKHANSLEFSPELKELYFMMAKLTLKLTKKCDKEILTFLQNK